MLLLMGGGALLEVAGIGAVPAFIATLAVPDKVRALPYAERVLDFLGISTGSELVIWGAVGLILVFAIRAAYLIMLQYLMIRMTEHHRVRIARQLFAAYMYAPYEFHLGRNTAELLRNVDTETKSIVSGIINPILALTLQGLMTLFIVILLVVATPLSGLIAIGVVGGGGWLFLRMVKDRMRIYGKGARKEHKLAIQAVNQGLGGFQDARVLGVEESLIEDFNRSNARAALYMRYKQFVKAVTNPLLEFIAVAGLMLVVLIMVAGGTDLATMVPMLGLFGAAIVRLRSSVGSISSTVTQLSYNLASVDAVVGDLDALKLSHRAEKRESTEGQLRLKQSLELDRVTYSYPGASAPALRDVSLTIERGQSVGFVGATGSGKTTLINVLLGLLRPQNGHILVDGTDIYANLRGWQNNIGYIPQSIYLLDDTIRRNVAFGLPNDAIDDDNVWMALRAAQLADHVMGLPDGLDSNVGERGIRLSGGQRQRVGLARALYRNPDVLIMDEATSALDNETENEVLSAISALKGDRTVVMIAHRLTTVRGCDCIYFLENGSLEAQGTYDELCAAHGGFRRMVEVAY